jgi:hypothetical protein
MNGSETMEQLSARERHTLDHLRNAEELGVSLEYYASAYNLEVKDLYSVKQQLVRKGVIAAPVPTKSEPPAKPSAFIPVRLVPSAPAAPASPAGMACRLVHPNGWVIECGNVPDVAWVRTLLSGAAP